MGLGSIADDGGGGGISRRCSHGSGEDDTASPSIVGTASAGPQRRPRKTVIQRIDENFSSESIQPETFRFCLAGGSSALIIFFYIYLRLSRASYRSSIHFELPIAMLTLCVVNGITTLARFSTNTERIFASCQVLVAVGLGMLAMFTVTCSCFHCAVISVYSHDDRTLFSNRKNIDLVSFLFGPDDATDDMGDACRLCVSFVADIALLGQWVSFNAWTSSSSPDVRKSKHEQEVLSHRHQLVDWYTRWERERTKQDTDSFNEKFLISLAKGDGHFTSENLTDTFKELLCSPASRVDKPDPVQFLENLDRPRFSGEDTSSMSVSELQAIMRGDILKDLGVSICFMLRFALMVEDDPLLEYKPIGHTQLFPSMHEQDMQTTDVTFELPGIVIPGIDQDIDVNGNNINRIRGLMDVYTKFPFEDDPHYFQSKAEYFAFYRWELESTIQDDFYFPRWLLAGPRKSQVADLMADRVKYGALNQLALEDTTSDKTLGDRVFYGAGQKFLTVLKLPWEEDYNHFLLGHPERFLTDEHRQFFQCDNKPTSEQLLGMIEAFMRDPSLATSPNNSSRAVSKLGHPSPNDSKAKLMQMKNQVVQIDFAFVDNLPSRKEFYSPGVILYLDAKSTMPIGVWESGRRRMFLPTEGRDWEHAKYFYRVAERAVSAAFHVQESHFGWSNALANAAWQTLPPNHGLRALVKPFTLNVHSVNQAAYHMLARNHSILTHGSGLTSDGVLATFGHVFQTLNFSETLPMTLDHSSLTDSVDTSKMPLYSQGVKTYEATRDFAEEFILVLYESDESMLKDDAAILFWNHMNTLGRHLDPCVCGMDAERFFGDDSSWPSFETTQTCNQLLDAAGYFVENNIVARRRKWCSSENDAFNRIKALRHMLELMCEADPNCNGVVYDTMMMRPNMGLPQLKTRAQLIDLIATAMWYVSFGHNVNSDNVSYFADPSYSGVRMREFDHHGRLPTMTDTGTYIFGLSIASLTTVRGPPLMADWTPLYKNFAYQSDLPVEPGALFEVLKEIHLKYKHRLLDLSEAFLEESSSRPVNQRSNVFNPMVVASSVSV